MIVQGLALELPYAAYEDIMQPLAFAAPAESDIVVEAAAGALKAGLAVVAAVVVAAAANLS